MIILGNIPVIGTFAGMIAISAIFASERAIGSKLLQTGKSIYFLRIGVNPPVNQIEMMGGFVYPQGTAPVLFTPTS